jgi:hypothetical protein
MDKVLEEILNEMKKQTALLEKLAQGAADRDSQTEHARQVLQQASVVFKGTPFEKLIVDAAKGGFHG